jgi:hypothetical protein
MDDLSNPKTSGRPQYEADLYEIIIAGTLDATWSDWLNGFSITPLNAGDTLISGAVVDQADLHGLLARVRDLNLKLISVNKKAVGA